VPYSFDAGGVHFTGFDPTREAWSHRMVSGDQHRVALYSGWDDVIALGAGAVLAATVSGTQALEAATGAPRWTLPGSTMYPQPSFSATAPRCSPPSGA
jgi:hypothetical protein